MAIAKRFKPLKETRFYTVVQSANNILMMKLDIIFLVCIAGMLTVGHGASGKRHPDPEVSNALFCFPFRLVSIFNGYDFPYFPSYQCKLFNFSPNHSIPIPASE